MAGTQVINACESELQVACESSHLLHHLGRVPRVIRLLHYELVLFDFLKR
jgi:hypothetical protein